MKVHIIENFESSESNALVERVPQQGDNNASWMLAHRIEVDEPRQQLPTSGAARRPVSPCPRIVEDDTEQQDTTVILPLPTHLNEQQSFLLTLKLCMLYICRLGETALQRRIQALVNHCTAENRRGNPDYKPLQPVLERKIPKLVGELHWAKTLYILRKYCASRNIILKPAATATAQDAYWKETLLV